MKYLKVPIFLTLFQVMVYFITKLLLRTPIVLNNSLDDLFPFCASFIYVYVLYVNTYIYVCNIFYIYFLICI